MKNHGAKRVTDRCTCKRTSHQVEHECTYKITLARRGLATRWKVSEKRNPTKLLIILNIVWNFKSLKTLELLQ